MATPLLSGKTAACALAAVVWCCWRLWRFTLAPRFYHTRPKVYPYAVPWVGHLASYIMDSNTLVSRARLYFKNTREPFALILGGETMYIITSAKDATSIFKHPKQLIFEPYVRDLHVQFGTSPAGLDVLWTKPTQEVVSARSESGGFPNPHAKNVHHVLESVIKAQLNPGAALEKLSVSFLSTIFDRMNWDMIPEDLILEKLDGDSERVVSLQGFIRYVMLYSATKAFFGDTIFKIDPNILEYFADFDEDSWKFSYKVPPMFARKMLDAKAKTQNVLKQYFELPLAERDGASWMIKTMEAEMRAGGMGSTDIALVLMMIYWVINSNAWKVTFWLACHIVANPELKAAIKEELSPIFSTPVSAETSISVIDHHLSKSPILVASYNEALRFSTGSVTVRMVEEDCVINNVCLQKGSKLIIPYGQMAMDENVFGAHPEQFDHTRFLKNPGLAKDPSFRPFGGGITYCPGRFLAQKEALMVVAGLVGRFDVRLKEGGQRFPRVEMKKPCFGMMEAVKGDDFVVVLRRS